jgi:P4 family phage/plasmid primase-like protien
VVGTVEFLTALFTGAPDDYGVEVRQVPGGSVITPANAPEPPPNYDSTTTYFGTALRRRSDGVVDTGTVVWCDTDGSLGTEPTHVEPPPTAVVASGRPGGYHLYWALTRPVPVEDAVRLTWLATVAHRGDVQVCDPRRVMRLPGSPNQKREPAVTCTVHAMDPGLRYDPLVLEERLVAATALRVFVDGEKHAITLALAAALLRAGWPEDRAKRTVQHLCSLVTTVRSVRSALEAVEGTYARASSVTVSAKLLRDRLGEEPYKGFLRGLGVTSRDGDLVLDGEVVGRTGNLERDVARHVLGTGDWASADGRLVRWTGTHWQQVDESTLTSEVFATLGRLRYVADGDEQDLPARAQTATGVARVTVGELLTRPLPAPDPWELPLANGTLDLRTLELHEHARSQHHRWVVPVAYDPQAGCPTWTSFVTFVSPPVEEGNDLPSFLQEWVAYLLTSGNPWQRMLWLYGPSGTGKSKFIGVVQGLMGPACGSISSEKLTDYVVAQLSGTRVAICSELSPRLLRTSTLKALVAGDLVQARHPYGRPFGLSFDGKIVWGSNALPGLDQGEGMWRRINVVPFNNQPARVDPFLGQSLTAELPGILNWAISALPRLDSYRRSGDWPLPRCVRELVEEYHEAADPFVQFFSEEFDWSGDRVDTPVIEVYQRYAAWAKDRQVFVEQFGPTFYRELRKAGFERVEDEERVGKRLVRRWHGPRLLPGSFGTPGGE